MSYAALVYGFWVGALVIAGLLIGGALIVGLKDRGAASLLKWRRRKLTSAVLGVIGLILLLLNFEQVVRDIGQADSKEYVMNEFLAAKFLITFEAATACAQADRSEDMNRTCGDWKNIDGQFFFDQLRSNDKFSPITNWMHNPALDTFVPRINRYIENINRALPTATQPRAFSSEARINIAIWAVLLVIVSLAGSIGEAAYQYRQAKAS